MADDLSTRAEPMGIILDFDAFNELQYAVREF
jgi:hypothetical protein